MADIIEIVNFDLIKFNTNFVMSKALHRVAQPKRNKKIVLLLLLLK